MAAKTSSATKTKKIVKRGNSELNAYVPDISIAEKYVGRKVFGVWDAHLADVAMKNGYNVLLMGDTGAGKTLFGEAYAAKKRIGYYSLSCDVSIDPSALFGRMQPTEEPGRFEWQDGPVTEIVRHGGVLNISEINFMPPKIAASLYSVLDGRRYISLIGHKGEVVRGHKDLLVIADMNPNYKGTMELNAAFYNRFEFKLPWGYDDAVEEKLVRTPTVRAVASQLRQMFGTELMTPVSTNMLMEFERFCEDKILGVEFASSNFVSAFRLDERQSVDKIMELNRDDIVSEISHLSASVPSNDDDLEEVEFEMEED